MFACHVFADLPPAASHAPVDRPLAAVLFPAGPRIAARSSTRRQNCSFGDLKAKQTKRTCFRLPTAGAVA
jgi:hypothetical protein